MINATEVNEENALFHSVRVNGGQAITHGKDLSSCTQAGNAVTAQPARPSHRRQRRRSDRENCHYRERGSGRLAKRRTKLPSKDGRKGVRLEKRLSFYRLRPEAPEVSTALKARIIAVAE